MLTNQAIGENPTSSIDNKLDKLEARIQSYNNPNHIFAYEKSEYGTFYALVNGQKLDIVFDTPQQLIEVLEIISVALKTPNDIKLTGDLHGRYIVEQLPFFERIKNLFQLNLNKTLAETKKYAAYNNNPETFQQAKNDMEELFVFIMALKGIPSENWVLWGEICKSNTKYSSCRDALGNNPK